MAVNSKSTRAQRAFLRYLKGTGGSVNSLRFATQPLLATALVRSSANRALALSPDRLEFELKLSPKRIVRAYVACTGGGMGGGAAVGPGGVCEATFSSGTCVDTAVTGGARHTSLPCVKLTSVAEGLQKLTYRYHSSRPKAACE
ncbi:TPA: hypothetical protein ACH3X2_008037 [Trebouxia sp. C0005]